MVVHILELSERNLHREHGPALPAAHPRIFEFSSKVGNERSVAARAGVVNGAHIAR